MKILFLKFFFFLIILFGYTLNAQENNYKNANYTTYINNSYISCEQNPIFDDIIFCDINFKISLVGNFTEKAFFGAIVKCDNYYLTVDKLGLFSSHKHNDISVVFFNGTNTASRELIFNIFMPRDAVKIQLEEIICTVDGVYE